MVKSYKQENAYILQAITNEGYSPAELTTDKEKLQFLHDTFLSEKGWSIERDGLLVALNDWLAGLPSSINIAFYNHDILELAEKWGALPANANANDNQCYKITSNYFRFMAMRILSLWNKHGIK